jgi:hypothetical protein
MLVDAGYCPTVENGGPHLKVRWIANGRPHLLVISKSPSNRHAVHKSRSVLRRLLRMTEARPS